MADTIIYILLGVLLLVVLLGVISSRKHKRPKDYRALFILGITWIPLGVATDNYTFTVLGIVFMIIGARHKSKWKENSFRWSQLTPEEKRTKIIFISLVVAILIAIFIIGITK